MSERTGHRPDQAADPAGDSWVAFSLAGQRFALPMTAVEAIDTPPPLALVPHATSALLGAGNFAGRIVPVLDLALLLDGMPAQRAYDGGGEILRLRTPQGNVGLWVDRVERLTPAATEAPTPRAAARLDPALLLATALAPPDLDLAGGTVAPLGDVADQMLPAAAAASGEAFILVEVAGEAFRLPRDTVVELVEALPWTPLPRAPSGLLGVGVWRGTALPILSPAASPNRPAGFVVIEFAGHRAALAVDRVVGLRFGDGPAAAGEPRDFGPTVSEEIRRIVRRFSATASASPAIASTGPGRIVEYLSFMVGGQDFAVPIASVDRVIAAQPLIALPRSANSGDDGAARIIGVIEVAGQIVPVASLESRHARPLDGATPAGSAPTAYVIVDGPDGRGAIGVDRIDQVMTLRSDELAPPPAEHGWIEAVAMRGDGGLLRIIATAQLWRAA